MTSTLDQELMAAGYIPEAVATDGVVAWTGWYAPARDIYETYYELLRDAMLAQVDLPPGDRRQGLRSLPIYRCLKEEYWSVIDCWRSASQVPPAAAGFMPEPDVEYPPDDEVCADCGCFRWYCQGPGRYSDLGAKTTCLCWDEELGEPTC